MENHISHYFLDTEDVIVVKIKGQYPNTEESIKGYLALAGKLMKKYGSRRFLADYREMEFGLSVFNILDYPQWLQEAGFRDDKYAIAILMDPESPDFNKHERLATEIKSKIFTGELQFYYGVFDKEAEAISWLRKVMKD